MAKWLAGLVAFLTWGAALGQNSDVGVVNLVSGSVTCASAGGAPARPLTAFSKIRDGDRIELGAGAQVRVMYFESSRQERWVGPASFVARTGGAAPVSGNAAESRTLPSEVPQKIARVPELVRFARLGGIQVRGGITPAQKASLEQQEAIARARGAYEQMRKAMAADDITPELFLYATLHDYLLYDDMMVVVEEMLRRQPDSDDARTLATFVRDQLARRK